MHYALVLFCVIDTICNLLYVFYSIVIFFCILYILTFLILVVCRQQNLCNIVEICDAGHGCCSVSLSDTYGKCVVTGGSYLWVFGLSIIPYSGFPCVFGLVGIETDGTFVTQTGQTCLVFNSESKTYNWGATWQFANANDCMDWVDTFNVTCIA